MQLIYFLFVSLALTLPAHASHFKKVIWLVFENTNYETTLKQKDFEKVAKMGAHFTNMHALTHPSQGNYIAMIAGSTLDVKNDDEVNLNNNHVGDLLEQAGMDWRVYAEDYPGSCLKDGGFANYARKHQPFMSFTNVSKNPERCKKIKNAESFFSDFNKNKLPEFSFFVPNLLNDGHDTDIDHAGHWLSSKFYPLLLKAQSLKNILFIVTFDENNGWPGNQIYTVLIGGSILPGSQNNQYLTHPALLRLIEDEFKIGNLGREDTTSPVISGIWKSSDK